MSHYFLLGNFKLLGPEVMSDKPQETMLTLEQQLESLKSIREMTQSLLDCKANLLQKTEALDHKQQLLEEITSERHRLLKEKRFLLEMIQNVQRDIDAITEVETSLSRERDELEQVVSHMRNNEYEPLHEQVNQLRAEKGLQKIPHVQQELEAQMAKMLEERRERWQHQSPTLSSASTLSLHAEYPPSTSSSRRRTGSSAGGSQRGRTKRRR